MKTNKNDINNIYFHRILHDFLACWKIAKVKDNFYKKRQIQNLCSYNLKLIKIIHKERMKRLAPRSPLSRIEDS